jgi:hypothetical protein
MVDVPLMQALLKAVPDKAALSVVGDIDQRAAVMIRLCAACRNTSVSRTTGTGRTEHNFAVPPSDPDLQQRTSERPVVGFSSNTLQISPAQLRLGKLPRA